MVKVQEIKQVFKVVVIYYNQVFKIKDHWVVVKYPLNNLLLQNHLYKYLHKKDHKFLEIIHNNLLNMKRDKQKKENLIK